MTTIATDGRTMASDSLMTANGEVVGEIEKVKRAPDGRVFGCCGPTADCLSFERWMMDGSADDASPNLSEDFSALVLSPEGRVDYYCSKLMPVEFCLPQAIGSGADFAIGAMLHGASPAEAVAIACMRDTRSGGKVNVLDCRRPVRVAA